jgi:hypothetical protein
LLRAETRGVTASGTSNEDQRIDEEVYEPACWHDLEVSTTAVDVLLMLDGELQL